MELRAVELCGGKFWCRKGREKQYVNCVLSKLCPRACAALRKQNCVNDGTLDLKKKASPECQTLWREMDECLVRATNAKDLSSLKSREET